MKTYIKPATGGPVNGGVVETERKPQQYEELRVGNDLYIYRIGKWRHQGTLLPNGKLLPSQK